MTRFFEVDALRGIALLAMIIYHIFFCLWFFTNMVPWFNPNGTGAPIAVTFVGLAGLSLVLAKKEPKQYLKRGLLILACATIVSIVTWIFYPQGCVIFGVLHLIAFGTVLAIPFLKLKWFFSISAGIIISLLGFVLSDIHLNTSLLIPLGIIPYGFMSLDYEPLFPWFGVMLIGLAIGKLLYPDGKRNTLMDKFPDDTPKIAKPLCFIGRHTLIIYLIHIPVIIAILMAFGLAVLW